MNIVLLLLPALLAAALSFALTPLAQKLALHVGAIDSPGERKVHTVPVTRLGGLAVVLPVVVLLVAVSLFTHPQLHALGRDVLLPLFAGLAPIFVISVIDDIHPLGTAPKLTAHLLGAAVAVALGIRLGASVHLFGNEVPLGVLAIPISILWIAGITNAFNIVDGLDGLSAGLALISAISLAAVSIVVNRYEMATGALILAGALLGFLPFNTHPAKVFLGDTGSAAIGYLLACFTLRGGSTLSAGMAVLVPIVVLGVPLAETLVSMLRRVMLRMQGGAEGGVFQADRRHFHHRLLDMGVDHRRAVLMLYSVGVILAVCGFASMLMTAKHAAVLLGTLVVAAFIGIGRLGYDEFALVRKGYVLRVYDVPMLRSALFVVFVDIALAVAAIYTAIALKFDDFGVHQQRDLARDLVVLLPPVMLVVFSIFRLYRGAWKVASIEDFLRSTAAATTAVAVTALAIGVGLHHSISITFYIILALIFGLFANSARMSYRILASWMQRSAAEGERVLIYGAGSAGLLALREILSNRSVGMKPIGFLDDDPKKLGRFVQGFPIVGSIHDAEEILRSREVSGVVVSSDKVPLENIAMLRTLCTQTGVSLRYFRVDFRLTDDRDLRREFGAAALSGEEPLFGANVIIDEREN